MKAPDDRGDDECGTLGGMITGRGNRSTLGGRCPSVILSTANATWTALALNSGLRGEKPAKNRMSCVVKHADEFL